MMPGMIKDKPDHRGHPKDEVGDEGGQSDETRQSTFQSWRFTPVDLNHCAVEAERQGPAHQQGAQSKTEGANRT